MLVNVTVLGNTAQYGAGVLCGGGCALRCTGCVLEANTAVHYGGGFLGGGGVNTPTFINSRFSDNVAAEDVRQRGSRCRMLVLTGRPARRGTGRRDVPVRHHVRHG